MRTSTAYFAGVGTVFVAVAAGLGGGYLAANVVSPPTQAVSKLERSVADRKAAAEQPIPISRAATEPVPYIAAPEMKPPPAAPAAEQPQAQPQPVAPVEAASPASPPRTEEKAVTAAAAADSPAAAAPKPVDKPVDKAVEPKLQELKLQESKAAEKPVDKAEPKTNAPRETYARASDTDVRRANSERRRAERRQQATERRQPPPRDELDVVEERVREVTEPRRIRVREEDESRQFAEPSRSATPRIRLFDIDD